LNSALPYRLCSAGSMQMSATHLTRNCICNSRKILCLCYPCLVPSLSIQSNSQKEYIAQLPVHECMVMIYALTLCALFLPRVNFARWTPVTFRRKFEKIGPGGGRRHRRPAKYIGCKFEHNNMCRKIGCFELKKEKDGKSKK